MRIMTRWVPDARARLERSALRLFQERGFTATTVQQITANAGLTTRTFFRHFADKAEVLFDDFDLPHYISAVIDTHFDVRDLVGSMLTVLDVVAVERYEPRRDHMRDIRGLIASDDRLRERDTAKRAMLADVLRCELERVGLPRVESDLLATIATKVLHAAVEDWLDEGDAAISPPLSNHIRIYTQTLSALFTAR